MSGEQTYITFQQLKATSIDEGRDAGCGHAVCELGGERSRRAVALFPAWKNAVTWSKGARLAAHRKGESRRYTVKNKKGGRAKVLTSAFKQHRANCVTCMGGGPEAEPAYRASASGELESEPDCHGKKG